MKGVWARGRAGRLFRAACLAALAWSAGAAEAAPTLDDFRQVFSPFPYRMAMDHLMVFRMGTMEVMAFQNQNREAAVILINDPTGQKGDGDGEDAEEPPAMAEARQLGALLGGGGKVVPLEDNAHMAALVFEEALPSVQGESTLISLSQLELFARLYRREALRLANAEGGVLTWNMYSAKKQKVATLEYPIMRTYLGVLAVKATSGKLNVAAGRQLLKMLGCTPTGGSKGLRALKTRNIRLYADRALFYDENTDDCATLNEGLLCLGKRYEVSARNRGTESEPQLVPVPRATVVEHSAVADAKQEEEGQEEENSSPMEPAGKTLMGAMGQQQAEGKTAMGRAARQPAAREAASAERTAPLPRLTPAEALEAYRKFLREL